MTAAIIGAGTVIVLAILGAAWALGVRVGRVETKVEQIAVLEEKVDAIALDVSELKARVRPAR